MRTSRNCDAQQLMSNLIEHPSLRFNGKHDQRNLICNIWVKSERVQRLSLEWEFHLTSSQTEINMSYRKKSLELLYVSQQFNYWKGLRKLLRWAQRKRNSFVAHPTGFITKLLPLCTCSSCCAVFNDFSSESEFARSGMLSEYADKKKYFAQSRLHHQQENLIAALSVQCLPRENSAF